MVVNLRLLNGEFNGIYCGNVGIVIQNFTYDYSLS